jgi:ankyrin repeat protein
MPKPDIFSFAKEKEDREREMPSTILKAIENITDLEELDQVLTDLRNNPGKTPYNNFNHFVNKQDYDKNDNLVSALAYAIAHENIELLKLLIKYGAKIGDTTDDYVIIHKLGRVTKDLGIITPLCLAVMVGNIKIVEILLQNGANARDISYYDPLSIALENNSLEIAELLINYGRPITEVQYNKFMEHAVNNNDIKMVEFILKNSKNVKDTDKYISPLSVALKKQLKDMVKFLISYGFDPYETEYVSQMSPLEMAEEMGDAWGILLVGKDKFEEYKKQRERERREKEQERERKEKERRERWERQRQWQREQYEEPKSASLPDKKYFEIPTEGTIEEKWKNIKKQFLKLSLKHHPDKGGNVDKFQEMSNEFDAIKEYMRRTYEDKIDVFHGGKRKQTKRRGGRNKLTVRSKLTGHKLTQRKSLKKRR